MFIFLSECVSQTFLSFQDRQCKLFCGSLDQNYIVIRMQIGADTLCKKRKIFTRWNKVTLLLLVLVYFSLYLWSRDCNPEHC